MNREEYARFNPGPDPYGHLNAQIRLHDLEPKSLNPNIKLSMITSTFHRKSQLERSLECMARQNWKDFEVIICDDGDTHDLKPIVKKFDPFLHIKYFRRERDKFRSDPSAGFKEAIPMAEGEIVGFMQPEVMLHPNSMRVLYEGHFNILDNVKYKFEGVPIPKPPDGILPPKMWVSLRMLFISKSNMEKIDTVDWHSDITNLRNLPNFWTEPCGLSCRTNRRWLQYPGPFPWWFVASLKREVLMKIYNDWIILEGYAAIDFIFMHYRWTMGIMMITPDAIHGYHQEHHRMSIAPANTMKLIDTEVRAWSERNSDITTYKQLGADNKPELWIAEKEKLGPEFTKRMKEYSSADVP